MHRAWLIIMVIGIIGSIVVIFLVYQKDRLDAIASNPNPLVRHFSPTWRSLKKIVDIPYTVASLFYASDLPLYEITMSGADRVAILNNLPDYPAQYKLTEEFKRTVKAEFRHGDYATTNARIRYRGVSPPHWNAVKKSWHINLPDESPLKGKTDFRFFLPEDKGWIFAALSEYRAKKLGLVSPAITYARLRVNEKDMGVYLLIEGWEESLLERHMRPFGSLFSNKNVGTTNVDLFLPESFSLWENRFQSETPAAAEEALRYLLDLVANASDDEFEKQIGDILNMGQYYHWMFVAMLSNSFHQGNVANQNLYFNPSNGTFEPISFDTGLVRFEGVLDVSGNRLANRVLRSESLREGFYAFARPILADPFFIEDDLAFYDRARDSIARDIMSDTKKIQPTAAVLSHMTYEREIVLNNFSGLAEAMRQNNELPFAYADESYPLSPTISDAFRSFAAVSVSRDEFLTRHPQFRAGKDPRAVILLPGAYTFFETVIVPKNLRLIIREGVTIAFAPHTSLVSYSPVEARGFAGAPITMRPLAADAPWGVFVVINAPGESTFSHVTITGGSDAVVNGMYVSGMLSIRNSDVTVHDSSFAQAGADDALHVLLGRAIIERNTFINNHADSIDVDYAREGSLITSNTFYLNDRIASDVNGDAIDISFSSLPIEKNTVKGCSEKGISVGEASTPRITRNTIAGCAYGIAVKDRSEAIIEHNILTLNEIAIGLYRKKPHFISGGTAMLIDNTFNDNNEAVVLDEYSRVK